MSTPSYENPLWLPPTGETGDPFRTPGAWVADEDGGHQQLPTGGNGVVRFDWSGVPASAWLGVGSFHTADFVGAAIDVPDGSGEFSFTLDTSVGPYEAINIGWQFLGFSVSVWASALPDVQSRLTVNSQNYPWEGAGHFKVTCAGPSLPAELTLPGGQVIVDDTGYGTRGGIAFTSGISMTADPDGTFPFTLAPHRGVATFSGFRLVTWEPPVPPPAWNFAVAVHGEGWHPTTPQIAMIYPQDWEMEELGGWFGTGDYIKL